MGALAEPWCARTFKFPLVFEPSNVRSPEDHPMQFTLRFIFFAAAMLSAAGNSHAANATNGTNGTAGTTGSEAGTTGTTAATTGVATASGTNPVSIPGTIVAISAAIVIPAYRLVPF